jgi:RimJ/RimL family protein N-acetyltransferase
MNADPEVMLHFPKVLDRAASDRYMDKIEYCFSRNGYGLWALERRDNGDFLGFAGLSWLTFEAEFTPAVEVGWRLNRSAWGNGYATEAGRAALEHAFRIADIDEVVSMTTHDNLRSRAVMERLGLIHNPADDFAHPNLSPDHPLSSRVLYRISKASWMQAALRLSS